MLLITNSIVQYLQYWTPSIYCWYTGACGHYILVTTYLRRNLVRTRSSNHSSLRTLDLRFLWLRWSCDRCFNCGRYGWTTAMEKSYTEKTTLMCTPWVGFTTWPLPMTPAITWDFIFGGWAASENQHDKTTVPYRKQWRPISCPSGIQMTCDKEKRLLGKALMSPNYWS